MDKEKGNGNTVLLTVIGVATLLVALVGATFAYFSATITNNTRESVYITTATPLGLIYSGTAFEMTNIIPGESTSNTFTVNNPNNTGDQVGVIQTYDLDLVVEVNTLTGTKGATANDALKQLIVSIGHLEAAPEGSPEGTPASFVAGTGKSSGSTTMQSLVADTTKTGINAGDGYGTTTDVAESAGVYDLTDGKASTAEDAADGNVPAGTKIKLVNNQRIEIGETQTYAVNVHFVETGKDQNENQTKSFKAHFEVVDAMSVHH